MSEHLESLKSIGLNDKQARAYVALLELGRGSAASVAAKAGLKSPTAYVILKELMERGFVQRVPRAKKQLFIPESPEIALASAEERVARFRKSVPALGALARKQSGSKTRTLFFEGLTGMKKSFAYRADELRDCEYLAYFATAEQVSPELDKILVEWSENMAKNNVSSRAIAPDHPSLARWRETDAQYLRTVRAVPPASYDSKSAIEIYPDFVRISLFGQLQSTIIEDVEFASAQRQVFEMVWKSLSI